MIAIASNADVTGCANLTKIIGLTIPIILLNNWGEPASPSIHGPAKHRNLGPETCHAIRNQTRRLGVARKTLERSRNSAQTTARQFFGGPEKGIGPMMAAKRIDEGDATALPTYNARDLTNETGLAHIVLEGQIYTLRITRSGKLILTK